MIFSLYTDGGARGNPGPAGIGAVIKDGEAVVKKIKKYIGEATNNQAEYEALIFGLSELKKMGGKDLEVNCFLDSELVVKQLNLEYKVKNKELAPLFVKVWNLAQGFKKCKFFHVYREQNKEADKLVNEALDEREDDN
ncbi:MAG: ribonuclease HI family protein [bacterium]